MKESKQFKEDLEKIKKEFIELKQNQWNKSALTFEQQKELKDLEIKNVKALFKPSASLFEIIIYGLFFSCLGFGIFFIEILIPYHNIYLALFLSFFSMFIMGNIFKMIYN